MSTVVTGLALEGATQQSLLSRNLVQSLGGLLLKALELDPNIWESGLDVSCVLLGLLQVGAPCVLISSVLVDLQFVGHTLNFDLPLLCGDGRMNNRILGHVSLHLFGHVVLNTAADAKVHLLINVFVFNLCMNLVSHVSPTVQIVSIKLISLIIEAALIIPDVWSAELDPVLDR